MLAQAVQALPAKLTDAQAQGALDPLLAAMKEAPPARNRLLPALPLRLISRDPDAGSPLARAYQALAARLSDAQAEAALDPVLAAMKGATDPFAVPENGQDLAADWCSRCHDIGREGRMKQEPDGRTTRHGYAVSQRIRKRIEEAFGWIERDPATGEIIRRRF